MLAGAHSRPDVAALDNGRFVTVWETGANVAFRFTSVTYGPDPNNPNNPDAAITTHLGADAFVAQGSRPTDAAPPGGRFVVLWYNDGGGSPNRFSAASTTAMETSRARAWAISLPPPTSTATPERIATSP